jgi:hypothetical protein
LPERYRRLHFSGQIRVVEFVSVADAFVWRSLNILATERVTLLGGEVRERHPVSAADFCLDVMNLASPFKKLDGKVVEWMEKVSDEEYQAA